MTLTYDFTFFIHLIIFSYSMIGAFTYEYSKLKSKNLLNTAHCIISINQRNIFSSYFLIILKIIIIIIIIKIINITKSNKYMNKYYNIHI
jgi:hypothetical protein